MPNESLYSVQVRNGYLAEPFPIQPNEPHEDRLFRHVTFPEDKDLTIRLRAVNMGGGIESSVNQKQVQTLIPDSTLFRIKAVLSKPEHGVSESHWVASKSLDAQEATSHNQYRIRGVSKEGWKGDWLYSELRGYDNEKIIYNMLHDVLDLLLTVHDDQIDYLMDYVVSDTFMQVLREHLPQVALGLDNSESTTLTTTEILTLLAGRIESSPSEEMAIKLGESFAALANGMKQEFKEAVMASPEEFFTLFRVYNLFDRYRNGEEDVMALLVETFLEDRYEKIVQKTDIEVLLSNGEQMAIYLNGTYKSDIKSGLIAAAYSASLNDRFVATLRDAVQLISETDVYETLGIEQAETVSQFLRLVVTEIHAPIAAADIRLLELEHNLKEEHKFSLTGGILNYVLTEEGQETHQSFLYDAMESLILGDLELKNQYEKDILENMLIGFVDKRRSLLIDYQFEEFLQLFGEIAEAFQTSYSKTTQHPQEAFTAGMTDTSRTSLTKEERSLSESYQFYLESTAHLASLKDPSRLEEKTYVSFLDAAIEHHLTQAHSNHESLHLQGFAELAQGQETTHPEKLSEATSWRSVDSYRNLLKYYPLEPFSLRLSVTKDWHMQCQLQDNFFIDGADEVNYALGNMDSGFPVGEFVLGTNTLKGEV